MKPIRSVITMACLLATATVLFAGQTSTNQKKTTDQPADKSVIRFTVQVDDVGKYLKEADAPKRKRKRTFTADGPLKVKDGEKWIKATFFDRYSGIRIGYVLTGKLKAENSGKNALEVSDLAQVEIRFTDSLLEAKGITENDVPGLIERLYEKSNKVEFNGLSSPGGEVLHFSDPMEKLMILGEKARKPLLKRLSDKRIRNEVALILGAIGDEATVPALIAVYPDVDIKAKMKAAKVNDWNDEYFFKANDEDCFNVICMTFALTYLSGQPIGRDRTGADCNRENRKLWKEWWKKEKATFKVPINKPGGGWVPDYPILTEEWAKKCRQRYIEDNN